MCGGEGMPDDLSEAYYESYKHIQVIPTSLTVEKKLGTFTQME